MTRLLLLLVTLLAHSPAPGAQCFVFNNPGELWAHSDLVFQGTVVRTKPTGIQGIHVTVEVATFRVDKAWKGKPDRVVQVGAEAPFKKNKQYLVFAAGEPPSTSLPCRWSELVERAKAKLEWLSRR